MKFIKENDTYFLRLERDEEIVSAIKDFCTLQGIKSGYIQGLGAIKNLTVGYFEPEHKKYSEKTFEEYREMTSLIGNISTQKNETYLHLHITASDKNFSVIGGHLASAIISATGEIVITQTNTKIDRFFSEEIGLNLMKI